MISISDLIDSLPDILKYIVPGYIALQISYKFTDKKALFYVHLIESGVISGFTIALFEQIADFCEQSWTTWGLILVCTLFDSVCGVLYGKLCQSTKWKKFVERHFGATFGSGIISHYIDWGEGTNAVVYLKTEECYFLGHVQTVSENGDDGVICLGEPEKYDLDGNELYSHEGENVNIIIPLKDVKYLKLIN